MSFVVQWFTTSCINKSDMEIGTSLLKRSDLAHREMNFNVMWESIQEKNKGSLWGRVDTLTAIIYVIIDVYMMYIGGVKFNFPPPSPWLWRIVNENDTHTSSFWNFECWDSLPLTILSPLHPHNYRPFVIVFSRASCFS